MTTGGLSTFRQLNRMGRRSAEQLKRAAKAATRRLPRSKAKSVQLFADSPGAVAEPVELVDSPPPTTAPEVIPASYLPAFSLELPDKFLDWKPYVATVPHGRIVSPGIGVVDAGGRLVKQSLWDEEHYRRDFRRRLPPPAARIMGTATSLLTLWADNYYHWLIDALPRLGVLETTGRDFRELPIIVPAELTRFQKESLDALGIPPDLRIPFAGSGVEVEDLVWASAAAPIGFCGPFVSTWLKRQFVRPVATSPRRLFISRRVRRVANEDEVMTALGAYGFELIRPEQLSFLEQVQLFASAELVIGPHGAGMANVVFGENLGVLELFQPGYLNTGPYSVARASGHRYWAMVGSPVDAPGAAKDTNVYIDPRRLSSVVDSMVESRPSIPRRPRKR